MQKGDVLVFDANIIHGSTDNLTAEARATMLYHFTPTDTKFTIDLPNWNWAQVQTAEDLQQRHKAQRARI